MMNLKNFIIATALGVVVLALVFIMSSANPVYAYGPEQKGEQQASRLSASYVLTTTEGKKDTLSFNIDRNLAYQPGLQGQPGWAGHVIFNCSMSTPRFLTHLVSLK